MSPTARRMVSSLRQAGLRVTPQRLAIVRTLADDSTHPTAQELYERLRPDHPSMSFATVYKTMDVLVRAALCKSVRFGGAQRFDPNATPHDHLVCESCGTVLDVPLGPATPSRTARRTIARVAPSFALRSVDRIYRGLCSRCRLRPSTFDSRLSLRGEPSPGGPR